MAQAPLITFKAGRCTTTSPSNSNRTITATPTPGYLYLYTGTEDELIHFCWRPRSEPSTNPEEDLLMIPGDATFTPLTKKGASSEEIRSPTNGRVFQLKFSSSGEKRFYWMQSKTQHKDGEENWFSKRDLRLGEIVNELLQGEDVDIANEVAEMRQNREGGAGGSGGPGGGEDDLMDLDRTETGGAGADATGGDPREEGEASREGGADGGRAASSELSADANTALQNFLASMTSNQAQQRTQQQGADKPYTTLPDLLPSSTTIQYLSSLSNEDVDKLCEYLPPDLFLLAQESDSSNIPTEPTPEAAKAAIEALSPEQKREILQRVLRSPQLRQSLGSLTVALRDGGLPMIGEALGLKVGNGGLMRGGSMPLGGGEAVEGFVEGVRKTVEEEEAREEGGRG